LIENTLISGEGYYVIISQSHESFEREVANTQYLSSRSVDGLLVALSTETTDFSHLTKLHDKGLPIVFFGFCCIPEVAVEFHPAFNFQKRVYLVVGLPWYLGQVQLIY
jgi:DNA-binding LacI/PurR family transcriptional regulator